MLDPTKEQLKELHKDIMSGDVMTITTEHYKQQAEQIKALEAENKDLGDGIEIVNNAGVKIRRNLEARIEELEAVLKEWRDKADSELDINAGLHTENAHLHNRIKELETDKQRLRDRLILTENRLDQARKTTKRYQKRYERR